jgi:hypothetical protein
MPSGEKYRSLQFPKLGIDVSQPAFDQRPGTTPLGINVRAYDGLTDRLRGGSRFGLAPFLGAGSTVQVSGTNRIQSLSSIVTASMAATFQNAFDVVNAVVNYSEVDHPPARDSPEGHPTYNWFVGTSPTLEVVTLPVVGTPDGGGTGKGTMTFKFSISGGTITVIGTFVSAGFPGPYFISQGQVQTKTVAASFFFVPPGFLAFNWTAVNFSTGFIAAADVVLRGY